MSSTYARRKAAGRCVTCAEDAEPGRAECLACREADRAARRAIYAARVASGICTHCGQQSATKGVLCAPCAQMNRARQRRYAQRRQQARWEPGV